MTRRILYHAVLAMSFCVRPEAAWGQLPEPLPKLNYETIPNFFQLPPEEHLVEPAGVAVNSKGHIYVFHRANIHSWNSTLLANSFAALPTTCL